jgi:hypothetical protein
MQLVMNFFMAVVLAVQRFAGTSFTLHILSSVLIREFTEENKRTDPLTLTKQHQGIC